MADVKGEPPETQLSFPTPTAHQSSPGKWELRIHIACILLSDQERAQDVSSEIYFQIMMKLLAFC